MTMSEDPNKELQESEYDNLPVRFNPKLCANCEWNTGNHCRIHVSTIERQTTITKMFEKREFDMGNPYMNKKSCTLLERYKFPKQVSRLQEV
jgi:hypothetical protein